MEQRRVLVTGGASGIGRAIADAFVQNGDYVKICGTDAAKLAGAAADEPRFSTSVCDVADRTSVDQLFDDLMEGGSGLDVLVNNAGIAGPTAAIDDIDPDAWQRTIDVNLTGPYLCARRAAPLLRATRGAIVNISSVAGRLGYALRSPYCASKFGLAGLTESLARELGPDGVRVNSILPGFVDSDRLNATTRARATATEVSVEEMEQRLLDKTSLRMKVSEGEIAEMALYLCSPAGRAISGQSISVCGNVEWL